MTEEEGQMLREIASTTTVLRDIVIQLLAYEANRHGDQRGFFERFSRVTTVKIERSIETPSPDATDIHFQETVLAELGDILSTARVLATRQTGTDPT